MATYIMGQQDSLVAAVHVWGEKVITVLIFSRCCGTILSSVSMFAKETRILAHICRPVRYWLLSLNTRGSC